MHMGQGYPGPRRYEANAEEPHNPEEWLQRFAQAGDGSSRPNMTEIRGLRRQIWMQTERALKANLPEYASGHGRHGHGALGPRLNLSQSARTEMFDGLSLPYAPPAGDRKKASRWAREQQQLLYGAAGSASSSSGGEGGSSAYGGGDAGSCDAGGGGRNAGASEASRTRPMIEVHPMDMLEAAQALSQQGRSVAVLNMANAFSPGGGVREGAGAQEENLHRRSDAIRFTLQYRKEFYPIPEAACLLSWNVTIFRGKEKDGYNFLDEPFQVCMISCAAVQHPYLTRKQDYQYQDQKELMQKKVELIVNAVHELGCDSAVLSAFGCGAFGNPPKMVAEMFRNALLVSPVKHVVFSIFDDHNAGQHHNPEGNIKPFMDAFGVPPQPTCSSSSSSTPPSVKAPKGCT